MDYLDSYFVPIEFDQRYPDRRNVFSEHEEVKSEMVKTPKKDANEEVSEEEQKVYDNQTLRKRRCCCLLKSVPFCGKSIKYKTREFIMTYEFGDKNKLPTIVMIHGYAGSALMYYPLFKYLHGKFHVIAIDLIGMGCSSRPEFLANSTREAGLFFIESIEQWRQEMKLEKMTLV